MSAEIFNGREFAKKKEEELKARVEALNASGISVKLVAILVGDDPASQLYVGLKQKAAERIGIEFGKIHLNKSSEDDMVQLIESLNIDGEVDGIMIQMPLPQELDTKEVTARIVAHIAKEKDVDGLRDDSPYLAATARAILYALSEANSKGYVSLTNDPICIVGATGAVGRPVTRELEKENKNLILCNSKTSDLKAETLKAKAIVTASGIEGIIKEDMVQEGVVIVDAGAPKPEVEEAIYSKASFYTPVPGGIGPMTVACLLENTVESAEKHI